ncbi:hypothetical protein [Methylobacterium soli]|uniref:Uncharacterized protein n=1 Tax=Methylobacterium soli TaxID=553447 RepID=A0A6L3SSL8_9HYPH|nr:hypothetical protein [Methylobacterium soli]KAB1076535.1 hypothetical protein F6X53_22800 [Methylobacterium soli]GJE41013.1 hypothetical protein AEGHOMDF_0172 [Methylobacterium soli]
MTNALADSAAPDAAPLTPRRQGAERRPARADPRLPKLRPCEIAAAAGLEAVRRALDDLLQPAP